MKNEKQKQKRKGKRRGKNKPYLKLAQQVCAWRKTRERERERERERGAWLPSFSHLTGQNTKTENPQ